MLYGLSRTGTSTIEGTGPSVIPLIDLIEAIGQRPDVRLSPVSCTSDVLLHGVICGVLGWAGRPMAHHRNVVRHAVIAGVIDSADRLPYHMMEERLILEWAGVAADLPGLHELAAGSMLSRRLRALRLTQQAAYQLTHDIMFLAALDPGCGPPAGTIDAENLHGVLADLIVSFAAESHWDLLGELLLCWDCVHLPQDELYYRAWELFLSQQATDGSFPGPPCRRGEDSDTGGSEARFRHRYHTTLVAVLAFTGRARRAAHGGASDGAGAQPRRTARPSREPTGEIWRDVEWLHSLLERPGATAPAVASGVLVGTWLCGALEPEISSTVPLIAGRVADLLSGVDRFESAPPALILTAYAILLRTGQVVPGLATFVEAVRAVLAARPPISAHSDLALCEKRVLLHQLGLAAHPPLLTRAQAHSILDGLGLRPTREQLAGAVLAAESSSGHGTVAVPDDAPSPVLERHAIRQFRSGEFSGGCAIVRASHHTRPLPAGRRDEFTDHLLLHQRPDGGYGELPGEAHLVDLPGEAHLGDLDLCLHLPTTLTCLWTLAELHTDFRLYRSIGAT